MLFSIRSLKVLLGVSLALSVQANEQVKPTPPNIDYKALMTDAIKKSGDVDFKKQIKKAGEYDLNAFGLDALKQKSGMMAYEESGIEGLVDLTVTDSDVPAEIKAGMADIQSSIDKKEILDFLGISEDYNRLFVFVSYSMPEDMIKAYAREAIWSGATLVLKGFEEGETFKEFVNNKILNMMSYKGVTATVEFDPRLFDAFDIQYVPSIVMSKENPKDICEASGVKLHKDNVTESCKVRPDDTYVKMSGAVTLDYALGEFSMLEDFEESSIDRLNSLRQNIGMPGDKEQVEKYNFSSELLPHQKKVIFENLSKFGEVEETEHGMIVKPTLPPQSVGVHFKRHGN